ncbi:hypothetical protein BC937DRAFT_86917 [Endogone sp. FLAS-F59071]|nr:hypothetical protein BC937DRAFT_86917 [Endogone sp. FLAS-F59071]|eukprot:RUS19782.1 hypothetical protein BC937DRAFT_86917 [Endogone sp. FLAS-F59071]
MVERLTRDKTCLQTRSLVLSEITSMSESNPASTPIDITSNTNELSINTEGTAVTIIHDEKLYKRYLTVWNRRTRYADGREVEWDIVGHDIPTPTFVCVFTFDTKKKETCLIKEFCQGTNEVVSFTRTESSRHKVPLTKYTCAAGAYDRKKHTSPLDTAQQELSEEARLTLGTWISLLPPAQPQGISELKWGRNRFIPYLVLDPIVDSAPLARDVEEYMEVRSGVPISKFREMVMRGEVLLPSVQTGWMAIEWLRKEGYLEEGV